MSSVDSQLNALRKSFSEGDWNTFNGVMKSRQEELEKNYDETVGDTEEKGSG